MWPFKQRTSKLAASIAAGIGWTSDQHYLIHKRTGLKIWFASGPGHVKVEHNSDRLVPPAWERRLIYRAGQTLFKRGLDASDARIRAIIDRL